MGIRLYFFGIGKKYIVAALFAVLCHFNALANQKDCLTQLTINSSTLSATAPLNKLGQRIKVHSENTNFEGWYLGTIVYQDIKTMVVLADDNVFHYFPLPKEADVIDKNTLLPFILKQEKLICAAHSHINCQLIGYLRSHGTSMSELESIANRIEAIMVFAREYYGDGIETNAHLYSPHNSTRSDAAVRKLHERADLRIKKIEGFGDVVAKQLAEHVENGGYASLMIDRAEWNKITMHTRVWPCEAITPNQVLIPSSTSIDSQNYGHVVVVVGLVDTIKGGKQFIALDSVSGQMILIDYWSITHYMPELLKWQVKGEHGKPPLRPVVHNQAWLFF